jgi:AraC-like DNA-binding protein
MSSIISAFHGSFGRAFLYSLDREVVTHAHREGHLLFNISGPDAEMVVGDETLRLTPETAVAISPWQPHTYRPFNLDVPTITLVLYIDPQWFLEVSRSVTYALRFGRPKIEVCAQLDRLRRQIVKELMRSELNEGVLEQALYDLTHSSFNQSWQWMGNTFDNNLIDLGTYRDFRIRKSIRLMRKAIGERLELDNIAREAGLSRQHFFRLFRQQIGVTPNLFVNTLRMEMAIRRLIDTGDSVTDIGHDLGFSSQASFSRFFISNSVVPPTEYRRAAQLSGRF